MRTLRSLIAALAATASVAAYAQGTASSGSEERPKESNAADSQSSSTSGSSTSTGTTPSNERPTVATGVITDSNSRMNTGDRHDMPGSASTAMTMTNDPELKNLTTEKFIQRAASSGTKEVQAAEIALRNSQNDQVKAYARELMSAHTKQNGQLTTLAAQNNLQVPRDLPEKDRQDLEKLRSQKGAAFDTAYVQQMQVDHQKAVALFQSCAQAAQVKSQVKQFCATQLPTLQEHHRDARTLAPNSDASRSAATEE